MRSNFMYFIRFTFCFLTMEFILHYMYMVAIKDAKAWLGYSAAELSMVGFWNLIIVWLKVFPSLCASCVVFLAYDPATKLLLPWRFFRLWALVDGIDPPENMVRCMANNYSTFGFWRSWHRSFNLWIVR
jgi:protein-cysteine N-palmitoyltransferase HHAT